MPSPSVFISYSHKDEIWKDSLLIHLGVLEQEGMLDLWNDRRIEAGADWYREIESAIAAASIAILMISPDFLTSKFIMNEEVPRLLERNAKEGLRIIPIILRPCAWLEIKWLARFMARPRDGKPLSIMDHSLVDIELSAITTEINQLLKRAGIRPATKVFVPLPPDKISLAKLPSTHPDLFGRQTELETLDAAWDNPQTNILPIIAWGGVGKTALVNKWLLQMAKDNYRGAELVYGWSFYSQGAAEDRQVSADPFISAALKWFGDPATADSSTSSWDKGERLAELIKQQRTLLILDGLEPLQNPSDGDIRDRSSGLVSLLRELAQQNSGLVVISTRLTVDNLKDFKGSTAIEIDLDSLSPEAGADYLKHLDVDGTDEERKEASHDFGGHALALTLMGRYLKVVHQGDIRKRKEIPRVMDEKKQGAHARRVMKSYERWLKDKPELDILRIIGLFDRPAERGALDALRQEPIIEGLTNSIQFLSYAEWQFAVQNLRELRLLAQASPQEPDTLDCHPLLREHFGEKLKTENPQAWREAHGRLYEYYKSVAKEYPDTLEEMAPLFAAVMHGCQAGRHQESLDEVYYRRIRRGTEAFSVKALGAFGTDLALLSNFFELPWLKPVANLYDHEKSHVLSWAGFRLSAMGRLTEAAETMRVSLETRIDLGNWGDAAKDASNLSDLYLVSGNLTQALNYAQQSVKLADHSRDLFHQLVTRTTLANVLHYLGDLGQAEDIFREAEEMQKVIQPGAPLYSLRGFKYCDLLLSQGKYREVQERVIRTIEIAKRNLGKGLGLHDIGNDYLSLGRAHLLQSQHGLGHWLRGSFTKSADYLNRAVENLRQAGQQQFMPPGLLARAELHRVTNALEKAQKDLDEAFSIATRGGMDLHLADCHWEYARLSLAKNDKTKAREHWGTAERMIEKMGYHLRDKEVEKLRRQL